MSEWKTFMVRGTPRYMKDGKLIKLADVPAEIREELGQETAPEQTPTPTAAAAPPADTCIFCGEPATKKRLVSLQTIAECDEHYYSESIGSITQRLREISNG